MSRALDDLSSALKPRVFEVLARLTERGVAVMIVSTGRSLTEHQRNLANGTSWTALSKHLPRALRIPSLDPSHQDYQKSDAIDLCPYEQYALDGPDKLRWDPGDPAWAVIGEIGESVGLRWGGRWNSTPDLGHLELPTELIR